MTRLKRVLIGNTKHQVNLKRHSYDVAAPNSNANNQDGGFHSGSLFARFHINERVLLKRIMNYNL